MGSCLEPRKDSPELLEHQGTLFDTVVLWRTDGPAGCGGWTAFGFIALILGNRGRKGRVEIVFSGGLVRLPVSGSPSAVPEENARAPDSGRGGSGVVEGASGRPAALGVGGAFRCTCEPAL